MSADTKAALDEAIAAHLSDEADGAMVTAYTLVVANITMEDLEQERTGYWVEYGERQPFHVSLGLIERHRLILQAQASIEYED